MQPPALLFDLDGTLLDTLEDLADTVNAVLAQEGHPPHPVAAYRGFVGAGAAKLMERALPTASPGPQVIERLVDALGREYASRWRNKTKPYPGIHELLTRLRAIGSPLGVLSNKPHDFVQIMVAAFFPDTAFVAVLGAGPDLPKKPDPAAALVVARALGRTPGEVLFLGDSNVDMRTAKAAGMPAIGAAWGFRGAEELRASGADAILDTPLELLELPAFRGN